MAEWQMRRAAKHEEEKAALDALLSSGLFNRAPSLGRLLEYICQKYFEGETDQIKEYNIAVEALNRPPHFDQKKDSIVRVEAHRLRKRLQQYYAGQGADLTIHITIPEGRYVPRFLHRLEDARQEMEADAAGEERSSDDASLLPVPSASPAVISDTSRTARSRSFMWRAFPYSTAAVTLFAIALVWWAISRPGLEDPARAASRIEAASRPNVPLVGQTVRIAAGRSGQYVDRFNNVWSGDDFFVGGEAITPPTKYPIRAYDSGIFTSRREGVFKYEIPLPPGSYELRLYFAEMMFGEGNSAGGGETSRVFNVFANGVPLLKEFDVIADAGGPRIGDIRAFRDLSPDKDGKLRLEFWPSRNNLPFVNAIEVVPGNRGHANPIRMVARDKFYHDALGRVWTPDWFVSGGVLIWRPEPLPGTDPELYQGERYGHFTYTVPVPAGRYTVVLHMVEQWFGHGMPGASGAGARIFNVSANEKPLLENFDLLAAANGAMKPMKRVFTGLVPDPQGKIIVHFQPVTNYACVNAVEILDEADPATQR